MSKQNQHHASLLEQKINIVSLLQMSSHLRLYDLRYQFDVIHDFLFFLYSLVFLFLSVCFGRWFMLLSSGLHLVKDHNNQIVSLHIWALCSIRSFVFFAVLPC